MRTLLNYQTHGDFTLCPNSTVASTFNPSNIYTSLEISKQISYVLRGIKRAIPRKLVKISHWRVSSFLKTVPGCRVSRHSVKFKKPFHSQTPESIMDPQSSVLTLEPQFMVPFVLSIGRNEIWTSLLITLVESDTM